MKMTKLTAKPQKCAGSSRLAALLFGAVFAVFALKPAAMAQPADFAVSAENDAHFPPPPSASAGAGFLPPAAASAPLAGAENSRRGALWPSVAAAEAEAEKRGSPADTALQQNLQQLQSQIDGLKTRLAALEAKQTALPSDNDNKTALGQSAAPAAAAKSGDDEDENADNAPAAIDADTLYRQGLDLMAAQHFGKAAAVWRAFGLRFGDDPRAAQAAFQLGECYYARGLYGKAAENYLNVRAKYKNSPIIPQNLLRLAQSMANLQDNQTACAALEQLARHYAAAEPAILRQGAETSARLQCP